MTLSPNTRALLDACASAIAFDRPSDLNLFSLSSDRALYQEGPAYLAQQVEIFSQQRYTVRRADVALFNNHVMGPFMYL
ncbi:MAG: hypothetical protein WAQ27_03035, partial [Candidatus Microsaccharimonas sp.]